jgi:hypothetical protein
MMKVHSKIGLTTLLATMLMSACGGSSDDGAGQLSQFQVSPAEVKWETALATCNLIKSGEYTIIGGTAPYRIFSPYDPDPADPFSHGVTFSAPGGTAPTHAGTYTVSNRNGRFAIYIQGCFDPATVSILDDQGRTTAIKISYSASS